MTQLVERGDRGESQKRAVALAAADLVANDSVIGIGSGSTVRYLIEELGRRIGDGSLVNVRAVPASLSSTELAEAAGVPLVELPAEGVSLAIDGMDEVDDSLRAIKGLGGALTREKIVAAAAKRFVLIGDQSKRVHRLAEQTPVPVELLAFGLRRTLRLLEDLGLEPVIRRDGAREFVSDNGNPVADCRVKRPLERPVDLEKLAEKIALVPGVVEHGLFLDHAHLALLASDDGIEEIGKRE